MSPVVINQTMWRKYELIGLFSFQIYFEQLPFTYRILHELSFHTNFYQAT